MECEIVQTIQTGIEFENLKLNAQKLEKALNEGRAFTTEKCGGDVVFGIGDEEIIGYVWNIERQNLKTSDFKVEKIDKNDD